MSKKHVFFGILLLFMILSGCSTHSALTYSISPDNVVVLRKVKNSLAVGDFNSTQLGLRQIDCRMVGPVEPPEGITFSEYIRKAFIGELQIAEKYDQASKYVITGNLDNIAMSSYSGTWSIDLTLMSSNGQKLSKRTVYDFKTNFVGEIACQKAALAFQPAVQHAIQQLVTDPEFASLVK